MPFSDTLLLIWVIFLAVFLRNALQMNIFYSLVLVALTKYIFLCHIVGKVEPGKLKLQKLLCNTWVFLVVVMVE